MTPLPSREDDLSGVMPYGRFVPGRIGSEQVNQIQPDPLMDPSCRFLSPCNTALLLRNSVSFESIYLPEFPLFIISNLLVSTGSF